MVGGMDDASKIAVFVLLVFFRLQIIHFKGQNGIIAEWKLILNGK